MYMMAFKELVIPHNKSLLLINMIHLLFWLPLLLMIREGRALKPFQLQRSREHNARGKHPGVGRQPGPGKDPCVDDQHSLQLQC